MQAAKNRWLFSSLVAMPWLAGCVVGPSYVRPDATLEPLHNAVLSDARAPAVAAPAPDEWWTGFRDAGLDAVVRRALEQNLELSAATARVAQARAVARAAGAQRLPVGEFSAQTESVRQSLDSPIGAIGRHLPGYDRNQTLRDLGASASWDLDVFGGLRRSAQAGAAGAELAEAQRRGVRLAVAAECADAFLQIRGDQARLTLAQSQIVTDEKLLGLVRLRLANGVATLREVAQAEALLARARGSLPPLKMALEAQLNRLDVLVGAQPGALAHDLASPSDIPVAPGIDTSEATSLILQRRPDVLAAERRLAQASARIGVAMAEYYPRVSLSAVLGFEALNGAPLLSADAFQPVALAGLHWRLFDFGRVDAQVANATAGEKEALADYRQTLLRATEDVENSLMSLVQLEQQGRDLENEVDALLRVRDAAQTEYLNGAIDLTDVLDADRQLLIARDELARTQADAARAAVGSFRALGGG